MAPAIGVNLRVTGHSNQGGRKYMEDVFVVAYQKSQGETDLEYAYFGIFDGHGGREAAVFAKEHLMDHIVNQKNFWSEDDDLVLKAIREGFITTHLAMWKEVSKWPKTVSGLPSTSGTTSSIVFIRRGKLYIGHVGDSRIIVGYRSPGYAPWLPLPLTKDHKPESPKEKKRIYSVGGLVMNKAGVERVVWNRPRVGHKGPIRRSTPFDQIPFLAVARSLGDLWSYNYLQREFVVSPEPDVSVFVLDPRRDRCIILATDGLWNMVTDRDAVRIVQEAEEENEKMILEGGGSTGVGKPSNNPSESLVKKALQHWYNLSMRADNTSVVTVMLDPPGPPKSEVLLRHKIMQKLRPREDQMDSDVPLPGEKFKNLEPKIQQIEASDVDSNSEHGDGVLCPKKSNSVRWTANLPKLVVLSPQRVLPKEPAVQQKPKLPMCSKLSGNSCAQTKRVLVEILKHETSDGFSFKPTASTLYSQMKDQLKTLIPDSKINWPNTVTTNKSPTNPVNLQGSSHIVNKFVVKENDQSSRSRTFSSEGNTSKECVRTHLSEVDNIVKIDKLDSRLSAQTSSESKKQENSIEEKESPLQPLSSKTRSHKRRNEEQHPDLSASKNLRVSRNSWSRGSVSSCRIAASRDNRLVHNTRSQQRLRKVKVR